MKRNLVIVLMLTLLATSIAGSADAQFWKKKSKRHAHKHKHDQDKEQGDEAKTASVKGETLSKKEQKKKEKQDRKKKKKEKKTQKKQEKKTKEVAKKKPAKKDEPAPKVAVAAEAAPKKPAVHAKKRFRVDVLAPLYLDELVKGNNVTYKEKIPEKALPGLAFYAGISIAADSLKKEGFNIDIYIHEIDRDWEARFYRPDRRGCAAKGYPDDRRLCKKEIGEFHFYNVGIRCRCA